MVPVENLPAKRGFVTAPTTWALRWNREQNFTKETPVAHVRWAWTTDDVDWQELEAWTRQVTSDGMLAELFVIDEELDVTMYRLTHADISGNQRLWRDMKAAEQQQIQTQWAKRIPRGDGWYVTLTGPWPYTSLGIEHLSGRHLRAEEGRWRARPRARARAVLVQCDVLPARAAEARALHADDGRTHTMFQNPTAASARRQQS